MDFYKTLNNQLAGIKQAEKEWSDRLIEKATAINSHANVVRQEIEASKSSLASRAGLDPIVDPFLHGVVNTGAKLLSGFGREAGNIAGAVYDSWREGWTTGDIPQHARDAYNRELAGQATEQDKLVLDTKTGRNTPTHRENIQHWLKTQEGIQEIKKATDFSGLADPRVDGQAQRDLENRIYRALHLRDSADGAEAVGDKERASKLRSKYRSAMVDSLLSYGGNTAAVAGSIAENAPSLLIGLATGSASLPITAGSYAVDAKNEAIKEYMAKNNGQLPSVDEVNRMSLLSAGAGGLEFVGDKLTLGAGKIVNKASSQAAKAIAQIENGALRTTAQVAGAAISNPITRTIGSGALAGAGEYGVEAGQTYLENEAKRKESTAEELHMAGVMGFWAGGGSNVALETGTTGYVGAKAAKQLYGVFKEQQAARKELADQEAAKDAVFAKAVEERTPEVFLKQDENYNPIKAMDVVAQMVDKEGLTPEGKREGMAKAELIVDALGRQVEANRKALEETFDPAALDEEISLYKGALQSISPDSQDYEDFQGVIAGLEAMKAKGPMSDEERAVKTKRLEAIESQYQKAQEMYGQMVNASATKTIVETNVPEDVKAADLDISTVQEADVAASTEAVKRLKVMAMVNSSVAGGLSIADARKLAGNNKNSLSAEDRDYFQKYAEAEEAFDQLRKSTAKVHQEVLYGDKQLDQKGLVDYRERFGKFFAVGNQKGVDSEIRGLTNLLLNSQSKLSALQEASSTFQRTKEKQVVFKDEQGSWSIRPLVAGQDTKESLTKSGSLGIYGYPKTLFENMNVEIEAIGKTLSFMEFVTGNKPKEVAKPTPSKPTAPAPKQTASAQKVVPTASNPVQKTEPSPAPKAEPKAAPALATPPKPEVTKDTFVAESMDEVFRDRKIEAEQKRTQLEKEVRKIKRKKPGGSLWSALKHSMTEGDLNEVYGSEWKKRATFLKGKVANDLSSKVADGVLDDFLPPNLRFGNGYPANPELESDAVEHIRGNLAQGNYLTYDTQITLKQLDLEISALDALLKDEDLDALEEFNNARPDDEQTSNTEEANQTTETSASEKRSDVQVEETQQESTKGSDRESSPVEATEEGSQPSVTGQLKVFTDTRPETQRIRDSLVQKGDKKPLVRLANLAQEFIEDPIAVVNAYLNPASDKTILGINKAQENALLTVARVLPKWNETLRSILRPADKKYESKFLYRDVLGYFEDADGALDENILTAVSMSTMDWAAVQSNAPLSKDNKEINKALGHDKDAFVPLDTSRELRHAGTMFEIVVNDIGQAAVDYLGLKETDKANINLLPRIRVALGRAGLEQLIRSGIVNVKTVDLNLFKNEAIELDKNGKPIQDLSQFVQFNGSVDKAGRYQLKGSASNLASSLKPLGDVIGRFLGTDKASRKPSFTPITSKQEKLKRRNTAVPSKASEILQKQSKDPIHLNLGVYNALKKFANFSTNEDGSVDFDVADPLLQQIVGLDVRQPGKMQIMRREGILAKNEGLLNDLEQTFLFVEGDWSNQGLQEGIYMQPEMWSNQRVGLSNTVFNPQTSKIVRPLVYRQQWVTQVKKTEEYEKNTVSFKLRVLEAFGVKTERTPNQVTLRNHWGNLTAKPEIKEAVAILASLEKDPDMELSAEDKQKVAAAVAIGKENVHTLSALVALASWENTEEDGEFTSYLYSEIDGVNNGPILTQLEMGTWTSKEEARQLLAKGGMFLEGSGYASFSEYRSQPGQLDLYEENIREVSNVLAKWYTTYSDEQKATLTAIWDIAGKFSDQEGNVTKDGRDLIKMPINSLNFGSSTGTAVSNMADSFLETLFKKIEKNAEKPLDEQATQKLIDQINVLLPNDQKISNTLPADALVSTTFTKKQIASIRSQFLSLVGSATEKVLADRFAVSLYRRDVLNRSARTSYKIYNALYKALRSEEVKRGIESGELSRESVKKDGTVTKVQTWDLTKEQEASLRKIVDGMSPILGTAFSQLSKDPKAGIYLASKGKMQEADAELYRAQVLFTPTGTVTTKKGEIKQVGTTGESVAFMPTETDPGVSAQSISIHSLDSFVSHTALNDSRTGGINLHDAVQTGVGVADLAARNLNKALWNGAAMYSPLSAAYKTLENTVEGLLQALEVPGLRGKVLRALSDAGVSPNGILNILQSNKQEAFLADRNKLEFMQEAELFDQYAFEGGGYRPTKEDKEALTSSLEKLDGDVPKEILKKLEKLQAGLEVMSLKKSKEFLNKKYPYIDTSHMSMTVSEAMQYLNMSPAALLDMGYYLTHFNPGKNLVDGFNRLYTKFTTKSEDEIYTSDVVQLKALIHKMKELEGTDNYLKQLGKPHVTPDPKIVKLVSEATSLDTFIRGLWSVLDTTKTTADVQFQKHLLKQLSGILPKDTQFVAVDGGMADDLTFRRESGYDEAGRGAAAWFNPDNKTIYVLNGDWVNADLRAETLLHEIVHAALAWAIANPSNPQQKEAVAGLEKMMQEAQKLVANNKEDQMLQLHAHKVADIQEFVAYGLTDSSFQRNVIAKLGGKYGLEKSKNKSTWKDGLKSFVNKIAKVLFSGLTGADFDKAQRNLGSFLSHTQGLIEGSKEARQEAIQKGLEALSKPLPMQAQIDAFTTQQVFEALPDGQNSTEFVQTLNRRLHQLVGNVHGPFGAIKARIEPTVGKTEEDAWANAFARGERPFHGKVLYAGIRFTEKEAFVAEQVEATMQAILNDKASSNNMAYRELEKVFLSAKEQMKGKIDEDLYRFVFQPKANMGDKSDYMGRFVALALSHEGFNKSLGFNTEVKGMELSGKSLLGKLETIWRESLDVVAGWVTGTSYKESANSRVETLVRRLVEVEARNRDTVKTHLPYDSFLEAMSNGANDFLRKGKDKAVEIADSSLVKDNPFKAVRITGKAVKLIAGDNAAAVLDGLHQLRNEHSDDSYGEIMELLTFVGGNSDMVDKALRTATKIQGNRQHVISDVSRGVMASFKDGGTYLSQEDSAAISAVLLRTGAHVLMGKYSVADLGKLLMDDQVRKLAIQQEIAALSGFKEVNYYIAQAKGLASMRVTGWGDAMQMQNAHNIAHGFGLLKRPPANATSAIPHIEKLIALYGFETAGQTSKALVEKVIKTESARGTGNGIQTTLELYRNFVQEAKEKNFEGSEALMMHGYLPEVHDPRVSMEFAQTPEQAKKLAAQGYVYVDDIAPDPADPDTAVTKLYVLKGVGLPRYTSGAFSNSGTAHRGTSKHNNYYNPADPAGVENKQSMAAIHHKMQQRAQGQLQANSNRKVNKGHNTLIPIVNARGKVVDYRYMMKEKWRNQLLNRDNRFDQLLGVMAASTYDKLASREQNKILAQELHTLYKGEYSSNPKKFVLIGIESTEKKLREYWDLLPDNTQRDIELIWGNKGMWVPKEMVLPLFGHRNISAADWFHRDDLNLLQKGFVNTVKWVYEMYGLNRKGLSPQDAKEFTQRAGVHFRRFEDMWQEVVKEKKDFIVVKTGSVLWGNILSNMSLLMMSGMSVREFIVYQQEALNAVMEYERDRSKLAQLSLKLGTMAALGQEEAIEAEIVRLKDAIARNPAKDLLDEGLLPTIVEDVEMEDNTFSYKSELVKKMEDKTTWVNDGVLKAAKGVYMAHDTTLYKFLHKATQYSDFVARYALFKHQTSRENNPLSKEAAAQNASDSFVNYSNPLPSGLQYLDAMGIAPFTKYALSIQRVLAKLFKNNPLHVISGILLNNASADLPLVTDTSVIARFGSNPFSTGAVGFPMILDDALTVKAGVALIK